MGASEAAVAIQVSVRNTAGASALAIIRALVRTPDTVHPWGSMLLFRHMDPKERRIRICWF
jgi:hypothetical protein